MALTLTAGIKPAGNDSGKKAGSRYGDTETALQSNIVYTKHHLNVLNSYHVYTESY